MKPKISRQKFSTFCLLIKVLCYNHSAGDFAGIHQKGKTMPKKEAKPQENEKFVVIVRAINTPNPAQDNKTMSVKTEGDNLKFVYMRDATCFASMEEALEVLPKAVAQREGDVVCAMVKTASNSVAAA